MHLKNLQDEVSEKLSQDGVSQESMEALDPLFNDNGQHANPFSEVQTKHKQLTFLRKHFYFNVSE